MMKASQFLATDMMEAVKMLMSAGQFVFYVRRVAGVDIQQAM